MKLTRLRLAGFKSFVDPVEVIIADGLTGIVGPNGCGKSNIVDSLRWVMGESSHKAMRAADMDEVIFVGSAGRPARNMAEVVLTIDNRDGHAPPPFADQDDIEVSRRIERDKGSTYRINGQEVRARDVQLVFADASTGAHSPALVHQGSIGEIIAAKPEARRRVLEEAAGIAGLHARRHEAELKLSAAEQNLERVEDLAAALQQQIDALKRQARQATRYRQISAEIRRLEAALARRAHAEAAADTDAAVAAAGLAERAVAERTAEELAAARAEAAAGETLPPLRQAAAAAAAAHERLRREGEELDREEARARERLAELKRRAVQLAGDVTREEALARDAAESLLRLDAEAAALAAADAGAGEVRAASAQRHQSAAAAASAAEAALATATAALAEHAARRTALAKSRDEAAARLARLATVRERLATERATAVSAVAAIDLAGLEKAAAETEAAVAAADEAALAAEAETAARRAAASALAGPASEAEAALRRLEVERDTLAKLLRTSAVGAAEPVSAALRIARGYEAALAAALGDDLEAPADPLAPAHWLELAADGTDPALPAGAEPLAAQVKAPAALARRLAQVGVVARAAGAGLQAVLRPGQRLVSREGDLWRWDGYTVLATAGTAAARRLVERARLAEIEDGLEAARREAAARRAEAAASEAAAKTAAEAERAARDGLRQIRQAADEAGRRQAEAARRAERAEAQLAGLAEQEARLDTEAGEAAAAHEAIAAELGALNAPDDLSARRDAAAADADAARTALADARAAAEAAQREQAERARRSEALARERAAWTSRRDGAAAHLDALRERQQATADEELEAAAAPAAVAERRGRLLEALGAAEKDAAAAADALAVAERAASAAAAAARAAREALTEAREALARAAAHREAAERRLAEAAARLAEIGGAAHEEDFGAASAEQLAEKLERLRGDRERLGGVNLRAEDELQEVQASHDRLTGEQGDLVAAIRRLRQAIQTLNGEGRERLAAAFAAVDQHFQRLFVTLFGGGEARLELVASDDPLAAGLEVVARPPGKRPQTLSLLSGGEQALTALALIFAIFLTNPAPICVLDEVDAPLDDANVERFCTLLDAMRAETDTRFLVVTHNPVTMSRMDRLFGVTMAERGVSRLVSVDLETAERLREAG